MDLTLVRTEYSKDGIFGFLKQENNKVIAYTLEHAYPDSTSKRLFSAKIPKGSYACMLGWHILNGMEDKFKTYEVCDVPGHDSILFHKGNYNSDSQGCILIGRAISLDKTLIQSQIGFSRFMDLQNGVNHFQLKITDA